MSICCHQINLQTGWGGGEVYTVFFTRALIALGFPTVLYINPNNPNWAINLPASVSIVEVQNSDQVIASLKQLKGGWFLFHTALPAIALDEIRCSNCLLTCIAHMPLYGRNPERISAHDYVIGVSMHVLDSLKAALIDHCHPEPLLGIADLHETRQSTSPIINEESRYDWDLRKVRDRVMSWIYPLVARVGVKRTFEKRPGITLGIVSRITPIKQFPMLFGYLAGVLERHPQFNLDVFGAGGYASVRDLDRALAPIKSRVRFWGHQTNVKAVYQEIDYLLTGLPEKEALGLNVIEAQSCGTPILAVRGKPFTETVLENVTGLFYCDPREDNGVDFDALLCDLELNPFRIDKHAAAEHFALFSENSFQERVGRLCHAVSKKLEK